MVEIDLRENRDSLLRRIGKRLPTSADMLESTDEFLVLINVPGCDEDEIDLRFVRGNLKVRAEREKTHDEEGYELVSEGRPQRISETVPIPAEVEVDEAEAKYENGVLRVRLPKAPEAKGPSEQEAETVEEKEFHDVGVSEPEETKEEAVEEVVGEPEESGEDEEETEAEGTDYPSGRDELEDMSYRDLQGVAKELDIKANQGTEDLIEEISEELDL